MNVSISPQRLTEVGLSKYEASAYLALLGYDDSTAVEVADRAGIPRQRIYDVLDSLRAKEMIVIRDGRPVRHTARPPARALAAMLDVCQRQQAAENARVEQLVHDLVTDIEQATHGAASRLSRVLRASEESTMGGF